MTRTNRGVIASAKPGDSIRLSKYLKTPVTVDERRLTTGGPVLVVESSGGSRYRLRSVDDDDDRLLMEKPDGQGWMSFIRLDADLDG